MRRDDVFLHFRMAADLMIADMQQKLLHHEIPFPKTSGATPVVTRNTLSCLPPRASNDSLESPKIETFPVEMPVWSLSRNDQLCRRRFFAEALIASYCPEGRNRQR